jgi:ketosteroid isomerase-like protein
MDQQMPNDTALTVRAYHDAWTSKDFDRAAALLATDLTVEVPVNEYPTARSFIAALAAFETMVTKVEVLRSTTPFRFAPPA